MTMEITEINAKVKDYMDAIREAVDASGKMRPVDNVSLDILESHLKKWLMAEAEVERYGILLESDRGNMSKNPAIDVATAALRQALGIMQDYGLTAMSLKKLKRGEDVEQEDSPLAEFFRENG